MKIKYYWKVLNSSGLLVDPREQGPHWGRENLNGYWTAGYDSEQDAFVILEAWKKNHGSSVESEFILIKTYQPGVEE